MKNPTLIHGPLPSQAVEEYRKSHGGRLPSEEIIDRPAKLRITELLRDEAWHQLSAGEQNQRLRDAANTIEACFEANDLLLKGRALKPAAGNEGMVSVPREPTDAMLRTLNEWAGNNSCVNAEYQSAHVAYKKLLAAALSGGRNE